ncbi:superoxide dismutase [bacterium]|nr:superoxide dismutase [bacterium]
MSAQPNAYNLPALGYAYDALEPHFDAQTMEIHHTKHHQAYINNALAALEGQSELLALDPVELLRNLDKAPADKKQALINNVGGHVNHSLFWQWLTPGGPGAPEAALAEAINSSFGSFESFKEQFAKAGATRFGSGWAWLGFKPSGELAIWSTANQDSPYMDGSLPILGLDVWEHAYYLKYQNRRPDYISAFWNVVNWNVVNQFFSQGS